MPCSQPMANAFRPNIKRTPNRFRPCRFSGVGRQSQTILRGISIDVAKQFRSGFGFVSADAQSHNSPRLVANREFGNALRLLRSELAHRIKDPQQRDSKVPLSTLPSALQAFE